MILGMSISTFTTVHVLLSLVGLASGVVFAIGMLAGKPGAGWTALFLATTLLTTLTGFLFPISAITPALVVGVISLVLLLAAIAAKYLYGARGIWRVVYVLAAFAAFYLNAFVTVVQAFQKIPFLQTLAPTQSEPPFLIAQGVVLVVFLVVTALATIRFRPMAATALRT
jgi:hypothetical protein